LEIKVRGKRKNKKQEYLQLPYKHYWGGSWDSDAKKVHCLGEENVSRKRTQPPSFKRLEGEKENHRKNRNNVVMCPGRKDDSKFALPYRA